MRAGGFALAPVIILLAATAHSAVFRCEIAGKVTYSDRPCGDSQAAVSVPVTPRAAAASEAHSTYELQREAGLGHVVVGQSSDQVRQAWGDPKRINVDTNAQGRQEQWVFERNGETAYVYIRGGKVSSLSTHSSSGYTTPVDVPAKPTQAELEAQDRADKADDRRYVRPGWLKQRVLAAIGVPDRKGFVGGESWVYLPTARDQKTVTTIVFDGDAVFDVRRDVVQ